MRKQTITQGEYVKRRKTIEEFYKQIEKGLYTKIAEFEYVR